MGKEKSAEAKFLASHNTLLDKLALVPKIARLSPYISD
jgi:hypothetical protein